MAIGSGRMARTRNTINWLLQTIDALAAAVPAGSLDPELEKRVQDAARFKTLDAITDIDLADPELDGESRSFAVLGTIPEPFAIFPPQASSGVARSDISSHN